MTAPTGASLTDFTAYELPTEKWMKLISPKVRLRVRGKRCNFVSPVVKVNNSGVDADTDVSYTNWPWNEVDEHSQPSFADDELFEILVERRFLLRYKRIRRTKPVTIAQARTFDHDPCTLSLYDGEYSARELEGRIKIGKITFMLS